MSLIKDTFYDVISGHGVKRTRHELVLNKIDYTNIFIECLGEKNYLPVPLNEVEIEVGYRIPGFYIEDSTAYYGHLFWEVFSNNKKRKIWGSVIRNKKGDWDYLFSGNSSKIVYLNKSRIQEVDIYYLT